MWTQRHTFSTKSPSAISSVGKGEKKRKKKRECITDVVTLQDESFVYYFNYRENMGKKTFVASPAFYVSQWTELLYFCKLFHILTCLHNKPSLQKRLCLKVFQARVCNPHWLPDALHCNKLRHQLRLPEPCSSFAAWLLLPHEKSNSFCSWKCSTCSSFRNKSRLITMMPFPQTVIIVVLIMLGWLSANLWSLLRITQLSGRLQG